HRSGNGAPVTIDATSSTSPAWVKLVRSGNTFTAYYATTTRLPDNSDWKVIDSATPTFSAQPYQAGLAVASGDNAVTNVGYFTFFNVEANETLSNWSTADIGNPDHAGMTEFGPRKFTIASNGVIWGNSDRFHFASTGSSG